MVNLKSKPLKSVDVVKFIMAIAVVAIHRDPFVNNERLSYFIDPILTRSAVPFFFISSAYFVFFKTNNDEKNRKKIIKKFVLHNLFLYFIWSIIYIPCIFVRNHTGHYNEITLKLIISQTLFSLKPLICGDIFVHLWFLYALAFGALLVFILSLNIKPVYIAGGFLIINIFLDYYDISKFRVFNHTATDLVPCAIVFISEAALYISLGAFLAKRSTLFSKKVSVGLYVGIMTALFAIGIFGYEKFEVPFDILKYFEGLAAFFLMQICLYIKSPSTSFSLILRKYSTLIYLTHFFLMKEVFQFLTNITGNEIFITLQFLIDLGFSVAVSSLILYLQKKKGFNWLKKIC